MASVVDGVVTRAFGDKLDSWASLGDERTMGFSGATVWELKCTFKDLSFDAPPLLVLKRTVKQLPSVAADADEGARLRAERTDFSYSSECTFINTHSAALNSRGCRVPRPVHVAAEDDFTLLMESFSASQGWQQHFVIPAGKSTVAVLRWLARFHAAFLPVERGGGGLPLQTDGCWDYGSHMALEKRPALELQELPERLEAFCNAFADEDPYFKTEGASSVGQRLAAVARDVAWQLRPPVGAEGGARVPTMTHGDFKQANLFFREESAELEPEVAVIDWQWTGPGVAATDVFFLCAMALADETVADYEASVLRPYHQELTQALGGSADAYPYREIHREFQLAGLDFMRWLTGARLKGFTPPKMASAAATVDINRGMWIRSMPRMLWLWHRTEEFLVSAEARALFD